MTEQSTAGTPDSNAGTSRERPSAAKDRACPFCNQQFTSSSLGRHLDLYIKDKNPKPADGIHDVDEIKKIRGHITRRQPRNSVSKRESSTPAGTPATSGRSPSLATVFTRKQSPGSKEIVKTPDGVNFPGTVHTRFNHPNWESTGVMNDIPSMSRNGGSKDNWDAEDDTRRAMDGKRAMSKQMLAKSTFEQKQKMLDALDNARAAELALREVLGSIRAANERNRPNSNGPLDYDPLALDFPALCLHCLPPPPTLYQITPIPAPNSWSLEPPDHTQYDALRLHFQNEFHRWRVTSIVAGRRDSQDSTGVNEFNAAADQRQTQSHAQEEAISLHLNAAYSHWTNLSQPTRVAHWRLELARSIGRKASALTQMKEAHSFLAQENAHLRAQVDQLSRLQSPREFRVSAPKTYNLGPETIFQINDMGLAGGGVGFTITEKKEDLSAIVTKAISRWKSVVQSSRSLTGQKPLGEDSMSPHGAQAAHGLPPALSNGDEDGEGERDTDMEVDDNYIGTMNGPASRVTEPQRAINAHLSMGLAETPGRYDTNNHSLPSGSNGRNGANGSLMGINNFEQGR